MVTSASGQQRRRALDVLGLTESASDEDIARAWRGLVRETHPDLTGDSSPATVDRLSDIMAAHDLLTRTPPAGAVPRTSVKAAPRSGIRKRQAPIVAGPTRIVPSRGSARPSRQGDSA